MSVVEIRPGMQILLRGQITDALTQAGLMAAITLEFDQGDGFGPLPFVTRLQAGGWFAVAARMTEIAVRLRIGQPLTLRLGAVLPGYQPGVVIRNLTPAQFSRQPGNFTIKGTAMPVDRIAAAPIVMALALRPRAVMLAGMVVSDNDPQTPVPGARVRITGPGGSAVMTNSAGRFRIDAPPLLLTLPLRVTKGTRSALASHVTDFAAPVNFVTINLPSL